MNKSYWIKQDIGQVYMAGQEDLQIHNGWLSTWVTI